MRKGSKPGKSCAMTAFFWVGVAKSRLSSGEERIRHATFRAESLSFGAMLRLLM